jgi:hypothetical protein
LEEKKSLFFISTLTKNMVFRSNITYLANDLGIDKHCNNLATDCANYAKNGIFTDIKIHGNDANQGFGSHRAMLVAFSPHLANLLLINNHVDAIIFADYTPRVVKDLLNIIYNTKALQQDEDEDDIECLDDDGLDSLFQLLDIPRESSMTPTNVQLRPEMRLRIPSPTGSVRSIMPPTRCSISPTMSNAIVPFLTPEPPKPQNLANPAKRRRTIAEDQFECYVCQDVLSDCRELLNHFSDEHFDKALKRRNGRDRCDKCPHHNARQASRHFAEKHDGLKSLLPTKEYAKIAELIESATFTNSNTINANDGRFAVKQKYLERHLLTILF